MANLAPSIFKNFEVGLHKRRVECKTIKFLKKYSHTEMHYFFGKMKNIVCKFDDYQVKQLQNLYFLLFLFYANHTIAF